MSRCPTPTKNRYATRQAAEARAPRAELVLGYPLYPYNCTGCDWWHLTSNPNGWTPPGATPHPADVARIQSLTATDFAELVSDDIKTRTTRADRLALRHPDNLTRWRWALKALRADINQQIAHRTTHTPAGAEWHRIAEGYRNALNTRITECQQLRTAATQALHHAA